MHFQSRVAAHKSAGTTSSVGARVLQEDVSPRLDGRCQTVQVLPATVSPPHSIPTSSLAFEIDNPAAREGQGLHIFFNACSCSSLEEV